MNYEFNLFHHVGVVAKRLCAAAAVQEGVDNAPSGPTWGKKQIGVKHLNTLLEEFFLHPEQ